MRIAQLLVALLAMFLAALAGVHLLEKRGWNEIVADETATQTRLLDSLLMQAARPLQLFTDSSAPRSAFRRTGVPWPGFSPENTLRTGLQTFGIDLAWIVEADGRVRLSGPTESAAVLSPPPISPAQLATLTAPTVSFYLERSDTLYRVRGVRLAADPTNPKAPPGWVFAAKRWDLIDLSRPTLPIEGRVTLSKPSETGTTTDEEFPVRLERIFRDFDGHPLRVLRLDYRPATVDVAETTDWLQVLVLAGYGVVMLGLLIFCLIRWIIRPADAMGRILAERDPAALQPFLNQTPYLARLAELVRELLETQRRLERTIQERTRLGRELHDGVIQTVYASGMAIAGARAGLRENPAQAEQILDETRAELNATIVDLRTFISGLDADSGAGRKFSEAVQTMKGLMHSAFPIEFKLEIDDTVADQFSAGERIHLLQIVREAISNAVRHGGASSVRVTLQREPTGTVLEISDDGRGFALGSAAKGGLGLKNFQARAQELGGTIAVMPGPRGGTTVRLILPPQT